MHKNIIELNVNKDKKDKIDIIQNNRVYAKELKSYLPRLYYLVL